MEDQPTPPPEQSDVNGAEQPSPQPEPPWLLNFRAAGEKYAQVAMEGFRQRQLRGEPAIDAGALWIDFHIVSGMLSVCVAALASDDKPTLQKLYDSFAFHIDREAKELRKQMQGNVLLVPRGRRN